MERARRAGHEQLFALSTDARMWRFFESLGFIETPRERLPEVWRRDYDLERPSRGYSRSVK